MIKETWKDIESYEGLYQVSNIGMVKSLKRNSLNNSNTKDRLLKQGINKKGYLNVTLCKDNQRRRLDS